jgi:hypothetical protein
VDHPEHSGAGFQGDEDMNSIKIERKHIEFSVFFFFVLAGFLGVARSILTQDVVWVSSGLGWDGVHYDKLLQFFAGASSSSEPAAFPFCARVGTPWVLVNVFGGKIGFYEFNLAVSAIFSIVFLFITAPLWKGNIKALTAAIAIPSFLIFSPIKFTNFYPVYMDPPFMLLMSFSLMFLLKRKFHLAGLMCIIAIPFREAAFYLIPLFGAFAVMESKQKTRSAVLGAGLLLAGIVIKSLMLQVSSCEGQSQIMTAFEWLYRLLTDPTRFLDALAAISLTLGPLLLIKTDWLSWLKLVDNRAQFFSAVAIVYVGLLSIVGGSDVTRIFYTFIPLYAPILINGFAKLDLSGFALACFGWLVTNQILNKYEQPIAEWPSNDLTGFFAQFPDHAHPVVALTILAVWLILSASHPFLRRIENAFFDSES